MRKLRRRIRTSSDLMANDRNQTLIRGVGDTPLRDGPVECLHSRNQTHNHEATSWGSFSTELVNGEGIAAQARQAWMAEQRAATVKPALPDRAMPSGEHGADGGDAKLTTGTSGLAVYRHKVIEQRKRDLTPGEKMEPVCTPEFWTHCISESNDPAAVSPGEKASMEMIAAHNARQPRGKAPQAAAAAGNNALLAIEECPRAEKVTNLLAPEHGTVKVADDQHCCTCGRLGCDHPQVVHNLGVMLRDDRDSIDAVLAGKPTLSRTPMSATRFAAERALCKHSSLNHLADTFDAHMCVVGRDLEGVPKTMPARKQCTFLCRHVMSHAYKSLTEQLDSCLWM